MGNEGNNGHSGPNPLVDPAEVAALEALWAEEGRFDGIIRPWTAAQVVALRSDFLGGYHVANKMSRKLWKRLTRGNGSYVHALGALTGNQAVQMAEAGLEGIYLSGWQVAADANLACAMYPDQSLYPANSVPAVVRRIVNALSRRDQVQRMSGVAKHDYLVPIVADAEAGFGGPLNTYELMLGMIEAGAAGVHFEDQLSSAKKCGHLGGKVLISTDAAIRNLLAARLAADLLGVPTIIVARTDADAADLVTTDIDDRDKPFLTGERTSEGFYRSRAGIDQAIARAIAYAPYADLVWCETSTPDLDQARKFAEAVHAQFPGKLLAYNCSPSFNWRSKLNDETIAKFQRELGAMGYVFQFITLAGFHNLNFGMHTLATGYRDRGMSAFVEMQQKEFAAQAETGFTAVKHQAFVGTSYFDAVQQLLDPNSSTVAMAGSTEAAQFQH